MAKTPEASGNGSPEFEFRRTADPMGIVVLARIGSEYDWKRTTPVEQDQPTDQVEVPIETKDIEGQ